MNAWHKREKAHVCARAEQCQRDRVQERELKTDSTAKYRIKVVEVKYPEVARRDCE